MERAGSMLALSAVLMLSVGCSADKPAQPAVHLDNLRSVSPDTWKKLSAKKIFFGHQSVGQNILDGVTDIMKDLPQIQLSIKEIANYREYGPEPAFFHAFLGQNTVPQSKIDDFVQYVQNGIGAEADIAFFKFCFIDFAKETDIKKLFSHYKSTMSELERAFPKTKFIHVTVPLVSKPSGIVDRIKIVLGRSVKDPEASMKRNVFNDMIRNEYAYSAPIFDLARVESTYPDGKRESFDVVGKIYYALIEAYTDDGAHLNDLGRKVVAAELLLLMSSLVR